MNKAYKPLLSLLAIGLLCSAGMLQRSLDRQRLAPELGIVQISGLENAPPLLAFTTVALGSFRGLIANMLWIRANQLQDEGKFFEMVQLSDWITKLEPRIGQVWAHMAWNMAYNISIRFSAPADRWRWIQRSIELLRDEGLRYNPKDATIYRELGWFFQHKIGYFLDEAHLDYKGAWFAEMNSAMGPACTNVSLLLQPPNEDMRKKAEYLRDHYKLDPQIMAEIEKKFGKLEWRLPEPHAIYWGYLGLQKCADTQANSELLITLRRLIYQSLHSLVLRGRVASFTKDGRPKMIPDLDLIQVTNDGYQEMMKEEKSVKGYSIQVAYRNFLREIVYELYVNNRSSEAEKWFAVLRRDYPDFTDGETKMEPYALKRLKEVSAEGSPQRVKPIILGLLTNAATHQAVDEDDDALRYEFLAFSLYQDFEMRFGYNVRVRMEPFDELKNEAIRQLLDPDRGLYPELAARLMKKQGIQNLTNWLSSLKSSAPSTNSINTTTNRYQSLDLPPIKQPGGK